MANNQITPFQLTDQFTMDNFNQRINETNTALQKKANTADFQSHATSKSNPHGVTAEQVGLGKVNNTSDSEKPVSTAQAAEIADAKKAGTDAQTNLNNHTANKSNPHGVTAAQTGAYTKGETDTLLALKRNWHGGHVSSTSVLEWAAAQSIPTECSCDLDTSGLPYSGYWMVQLSIYPEGGWRMLKATNVLNDDVYIIKQNGGIWDTEWTHIVTDTDLVNRPKISIGSYVGTGTYGYENQNILTFNFEPKIVLISCALESRIGQIDVVVCMRGAGFAYTHRNNTNYYIRLVWSGNALNWYDGGVSAMYQLNDSGVTYNYVALG